MELIFDIGMYNGCDTEYYLSEGYRVVSVEANPGLVKKAEERFEDQIASGQLVLVNKAICDTPETTITLAIDSDDLGSSSIVEDKIASKNTAGSYRVQGTTLSRLIEEHGRPYFIKVDIEGADRYAILSLNRDNRPRYISFEAGDDVEELVGHLSEIGFTRFKAINQCNFHALDNQESLPFRIKRKMMHWLGYQSPRYSRHNGRFFLLEHSAGPPPWMSEGRWRDATGFLDLWRAKKGGDMNGWYDIHAM